MALLTYYTENAAFGPHYSCSTVAPATTFLANVGWNVGSLTPPLFSALDYATEIARGSITATVPISTLNTGAGAGNGIFVFGPLTGSFADGNWQITQSVKANTAGTTADGNFHYRFFRGTDSTGAGATAIGTTYATSSTATNIVTTAHQVCSTLYNPGALDLDNEYLFVACQWKLTGAGGGNTHDVNIYVGGVSGSVLKTTDFTDNYTPPVAPTVTMKFMLWMDSD